MSAWSHLTGADALRRARTLDQLAGPDGIIVGAAADHRDSLRAVLAKHGLEVDDATVGRLKAQVAASLAGAVSLILLDIELGAPAAIAAGALGGTTALVVPLEDQGYGDVATVAQTALMERWSPREARRMGATACKLLLPFRVDAVEQAARQEAIAATCAAACRAEGTVLVLEPIVYRRAGEEMAAERYAELVVAGAERLARTDPGLLKVQYPGSPDACRALDAACGPATPWVLLGGGATEEVLIAQIEDACRAGASGFIVGRTLWSDALVPDAAARDAILRERPGPRLARLAAVAREHAAPWRARVGALPAAGDDPFRA
jgi:tagatose-1,6-bisphosphate aldolase